MIKVMMTTTRPLGALSQSETSSKQENHPPSEPALDLIVDDVGDNGGESDVEWQAWTTGQDRSG